MPSNENARTAGFTQFFMSDKSGRRRLDLNTASVMDQIIYGRGVGGSAADPHKEFMGKFGDFAGLKSGTGDAEERPFRKPGIAQNSVMDEVILGRTFERSGPDPQEHFKASYPDHAGVKCGDKPERPSKKGAYAMSSTMDSIVWGRDFDGSGDDPHGHFQKNFNGHAGVVYDNSKPQKPFRRLIFNKDNVMKHVITGLGEYGDPHKKFMSSFGDYAGLKAGQSQDRPFRKPGLNQRSSVNEVLSPHAGDGDTAHEEFFLKTFFDHAGKRSGHRHGRSKLVSRGLVKSFSEPPPSTRDAYTHGEDALELMPSSHGSQSRRSGSRRLVLPDAELQAAALDDGAERQPSGRRGQGTPRVCPVRSTGAASSRSGSSGGSARSRGAGAGAERAAEARPAAAASARGGGGSYGRPRRAASVGGSTTSAGSSRQTGGRVAAEDLASTRSSLRSSRASSVGSLTGRSRGSSGTAGSAGRTPRSRTSSSFSTTACDYGRGCWGASSGKVPAAVNKQRLGGSTARSSSCSGDLTSRSTATTSSSASAAATASSLGRRR